MTSVIDKCSCLLTSFQFLVQFVQYRRLDDDLRDTVRIAVGGWTPVLEVPTFVFSDLAWNSYAGPSVRYTCAEVIDAGGLAGSRQSTFVVPSLVRVVGTDVFPMLVLHPFDGFGDYTGNRNK